MSWEDERRGNFNESCCCFGETGSEIILTQGGQITSSVLANARVHKSRRTEGLKYFTVPVSSV